jgi:hypothetical protein
LVRKETEKGRIFKKIGRKIKHENTTRGIVNKGFSDIRGVVTRFKSYYNLIGKCPQSLTNHTATVRGKLRRKIRRRPKFATKTEENITKNCPRTLRHFLSPHRTGDCFATKTAFVFLTHE